MKKNFKLYKGKILDLSSFDTSAITDMSGMFNGCKSLNYLDLSSFDTSNVTYMISMFDGCKSLTSLDLSSFNTSAVTDMSGMFGLCSSLTSLDKFTVNTNNVTSMNSMFDGCYSLTDLKFGTNLKVSLSLSDSPLTHASALSVLNGLAAITTSKTITFKATTYSTLTAAEIKTATDKGWTITSV